MTAHKWTKLGFVENIVKSISWSSSHAQVPVPVLLNDRIRVFFATRPDPTITKVTFCDLSLTDPLDVIYVHDKPVLELGDIGCFDQFGVMPSSIVRYDRNLYLYYSGWSRMVGVPYANYTGLAISYNDGLSFERVSKAPIIDRSKYDLYSATSPEVYFDGRLWHMWYCSGTKWHTINGNHEHVYDIKYAYSTDGISWNREGVIVVKQENEFEAITKPAVAKIGKAFHMWFCYRGSIGFRDVGDTYKIGYAFSEDLKIWNRDDNLAGINKSSEGWDSQMIAYPSLLKVKDNLYMFYNGNNFGKLGFGIAKLEYYE